MIMLLKPRTGRQSPMRELGNVCNLFRPWRDFHSVSCLIPSDESLGYSLSPKGLFNPPIINAVRYHLYAAPYFAANRTLPS
jgi:hypothetical protein